MPHHGNRGELPEPHKAHCSLPPTVLGKGGNIDLQISILLDLKVH